jgi:excinuclease ABC subunit A
MSGAEFESLIRVVGARAHNLRGVEVSIRRDCLTVVTGVSGSGKSSLAFDTIHAEGQRRYVESLSTRARQFLEQLPKPDVDRIDGLCPTIAIEQWRGTGSPRSTVATTTEIHDFLRVLFARVGVPHCWTCGRVIERNSVADVVDCVMNQSMGSRLMLMAPMVDSIVGGHKKLLSRIIKEGYVRARIDGDVVSLDELPSLPASKPHTIDVLVDRLVVKDGIESRVADSVELAIGLSGGRVIVSVESADSRKAEYDDFAFGTNYACPDHPVNQIADMSPSMFSFNSPRGACETCTGLGVTMSINPNLVVPDANLTLNEHAIAAWARGPARLKSIHRKLLEKLGESFGVPLDIPYSELPETSKRILMHGTTPQDEEQYGTSFEGVLANLERRWSNAKSGAAKRRLQPYLGHQTCDACNGRRLQSASLAVRIDTGSGIKEREPKSVDSDVGRYMMRELAGFNIAEVCGMNIGTARRWFESINWPGESAVVAEPLVREIRDRLRFLDEVGVGYLSLDRRDATLSGGESQRIRLATQIGSGLSGVCFVLDEPTIGLHQRDTGRLIDTLKRLVHSGNTAIVVEHDEEVIAAADEVIDVGPGAGAHGGDIVAQGSVSEVVSNKLSRTGDYLSGRCSIEIPDDRRVSDSDRMIHIFGASENNLQHIDVGIPLGLLVCVTGVSGSGKSTLVSDTLLRVLKRRINGSGSAPGAFERISGASHVERVIEIDQSPIGRSPRSNPATFTGVFDLIRKRFAETREAKVRGYSAARFSFNVKGGRCEACRGQGVRRVEMHFLPDVFVECSRCSGTRFSRETLEVRYRGQTIADILEMRVEEAAEFFENFPRLVGLLKTLEDVGLGYVTLGQSSATLSGGEAQRVKLAAELGKPATGHTMYILDEPTTGLHPADIDRLMTVLQRLVDLGHSMVVIEHNLDVIKCADWVIDLGPEAGEGGGRIVAEGTPEGVADCELSLTGRYLREKLRRKHR